jgi:hypothetical protein
MITNLVAAVVVTLVTNVTETDNHQDAHPIFEGMGIQQARYVAADKKERHTSVFERTELVSEFEGQEVRLKLKDDRNVTNWTEYFEVLPAQWRRTKVEPGPVPSYPDDTGVVLWTGTPQKLLKPRPIENSEPTTNNAPFLLFQGHGWKLTPNSGPAYERMGLGVLRREGAAEEDTSTQDSHGAVNRELLRFMGTTVRDDLMELTNRLTKLKEALQQRRDAEAALSSTLTNWTTEPKRLNSSDHP